MEINENTKLIEILNAYPWLEDEVVKLDEQFKIIKTPFGKMMAKKLTVKDACEMGKVSMEDLMNQLNQMIEEHDKQNA